MSIRKKHIILPAIITLTGLVGGCFIWYGWMTPNSSKEASGVVLDWRYTEKIYPDIDTSKLSDTQKKIVSLTKQEYLAQSSGVKFSEGANEAWCADFVSWIMKEASMPLENPNSGSWRIPGTFILQDYYVTAGRFMAVNSGYEPKLGDVAIYRGSPVFGDHANIILSNQNGVLTTVGGNEGNRIRVYVNTQKNYEGLLGYGTMEG